ncbi:MAG TPA: hypothetical protein VE129_01730 [Thermoanaerobaculia bacterium]|nr:hypothetical protein [Thermoanaerobaculia bacterium]
MNTDPILDGHHRQREDFLRECGNDPEVIFRKLKELEASLPQPVQPAPSPEDPSSRRPRQSRG